MRNVGYVTCPGVVLGLFCRGGSRVVLEGGGPGAVLEGGVLAVTCIVRVYGMAPR